MSEKDVSTRGIAFLISLGSIFIVTMILSAMLESWIPSLVFFSFLAVLMLACVIWGKDDEK